MSETWTGRLIKAPEKDAVARDCCSLYSDLLYSTTPRKSQAAKKIQGSDGNTIVHKLNKSQRLTMEEEKKNV